MRANIFGISEGSRSAGRASAPPPNLFLWRGGGPWFALTGALRSLKENRLRHENVARKEVERQK